VDRDIESTHTHALKIFIVDDKLLGRMAKGEKKKENK